MKLNVEDNIILNTIELREYQKPIFDAIFNRGIKRLALTLPRRSGKDLTCWSAVIRWALTKPCMSFYVLPTAPLARKVIWDAKDNSGRPFLSYIPERLITRKNETEMKLTLANGSIIQLVGAEQHDTVFRGSNPTFIVLSEFAYYRHPEIIDTVSPILAANGGVLIINSTPQGKNGYYSLFKYAEAAPEWFTYFKTVEDTRHISQEMLDQERRRMGEETFLQEYYCSFDRGISGAIFGKALADLRLQGHITTVPWNPGLLVHVAFDIGLSKGNATTLVFFQVVGDGQIINVIDCYSSENLGLDTYVKLMQDKPYKYGVYLAPHDLEVREWGHGAVTRYEKARSLGIDFTVEKQMLLGDQIENALTHFPKIWIDETKCKSLLNALENYFREWDEQRQVYKPKPVHNWASNYASAFMLMCQGLSHTASGKSGEEYDRLRKKMLYGDDSNLPGVFRRGLNQNQY